MQLKSFVYLGLAGLMSMAVPVAPAVAGDDGVSINHITDDRGNGNFWIKSGDLDLRAEWHGGYSINEAGTGIDEVDGRLEIEQSKGRDTVQVVFRGNGDTYETIYRVNDRPREIDDSAVDEIAALVRLFVLESGVDANERVAVLHAKGGAAAVFREIEEISGGHAARKYLTALVETAPLSAIEIARYAEFIPRLNGDHDRRKAIGAVFEHQQNISAESRAILLTAARNIESDHEIRKLMESAANGELTPDAIETCLTLLQQISGDHELRKGSEVLLENPSFSDEAAIDLLLLAGRTIDSDHELRKTVEYAEARFEGNQRVASAAISAIAEIGSDHEKRKASETLARAMNQQWKAEWASLIAVADSVQSDHEKRKALTTIAERMPGDTNLAAMYRAAAEAISSENERDKALANIKRN